MDEVWALHRLLGLPRIGIRAGVVAAVCFTLSLERCASTSTVQYLQHTIGAWSVNKGLNPAVPCSRVHVGDLNSVAVEHEYIIILCHENNCNLSV